MHYFAALLVLCITLVQMGYSASYNNCRLMPQDKELYHRRIQKDQTRHKQMTVVSFPERLIDRPLQHKVITCIRCQDLQEGSDPEDSECKIIAGGVGYTFAKITVSSKPHRSFDYDIKVFGHDKWI